MILNRASFLFNKIETPHEDEKQKATCELMRPSETKTRIPFDVWRRDTVLMLFNQSLSKHGRAKAAFVMMAFLISR